MTIFADICVSDQYDHLWNNCLTYIKENCHSDPLYQNYVNLKKQDFISIAITIEDNAILAFSCAQFNVKKWGDQIARVSTRFWLHPSVRSKGLTKFTPGANTWYNSQYMMRYQLDAVNQLNLPASFISREGNYKNSFQKYINLVNNYNDTNFILLDGLYTVCGPMSEVPDSCKQMIAVNVKDKVDPEYFIRNHTTLKKVNNSVELKV
jgi:hypothetical protein